MNKTIVSWLSIGWISVLFIPWYSVEDGFWSIEWVRDGFIFNENYASVFILNLAGEKLWLSPLFLFLTLPLLIPLFTRVFKKKHKIHTNNTTNNSNTTNNTTKYAGILIVSGLAGLGYIVLQGYSIGIRGWEFQFLERFFDVLEDRQFGMGYGAMFLAISFLFLFTQGLAAKGAVNGDVFIVSSIGFIIAVVATFIFLPVSNILLSAFQDNDRVYSVSVFAAKFFDKKIWGLDCLYSSIHCGSAWNTLFLATLVGLSTSLLGLAFALVATRAFPKHRKLFRALSVLPIITPPFVIGLAIILLFGLSGMVTQFIGNVLDISPTRWIYGLPGIWLAQMLAFTPIAFLVLIGVVEGISLSMEEAAQTLGANSWKTFSTISLPLMRPGLANAFLLGFIESMADFGNPLILGGNYDVLSTDIFFSIVGAQNDQGFAAVLAIVLLGFTVSAFFVQRRWLGKKSYTSISGKGDLQSTIALPIQVRSILYPVVGFWVFLSLVIYGMIVFGSFVNVWGLDHVLTFKHYKTAFAFNFSDTGIHWSGSAWDSFNTTLFIAAVSAPLTAALGLVTAYLLTRQKFSGKSAFEFVTMISFAIPGTVIGVSYILSFNIPPIELTGTASILVLCFIFRNMPVGVRAGIASMSQLDKSLDEASLCLGASSFKTFRKIILPLLRPAIVAALVYSFVRAMTAISAVIFLVSAKYNMATSYIIGRVENNDYGLAIAYCVVLILVMLLAILLFQYFIAERGRDRFATSRE